MSRSIEKDKVCGCSIIINQSASIMMDYVYAFGISVIQYIQNNFEENENFLLWANYLADPHHSWAYVLPFIAVFDSVFACQYTLCVSVGLWLNAILKWIFAEHRPYWWVRETDYYPDNLRPSIKQFPETCETGPGCPSGHVMHTAIQIGLLIMWTAHIKNDRKWNIKRHKCILWPLCAGALLSVMIARMYIGTHFIHQCILGAIFGVFTAPFLCIYVVDPFLWGHLPQSDLIPRVGKHLVAVTVMMVTTVMMYSGMKSLGIDPQWSVLLAFKWCVNFTHINVNTTPLYSLVESLGILCGLAVVTMPDLSRYRHYTQRRNLLLAIFASAFIQVAVSACQRIFSNENVVLFYTLVFLSNALIPGLYLRAVPAAARLPYTLLDKYKKQK